MHDKLARELKEKDMHHATVADRVASLEKNYSKTAKAAEELRSNYSKLDSRLQGVQRAWKESPRS